ncbi:hypothetical protein Cs7R123_37280 [Catellatospora sp. TT07R-123]|uniref:hypothetical protein n=1 Tax=Catellatospora sp. TT07R-123 TaxID=2733863 RepID=UPI001B0008ED|nr:hypothetical protein [Catellatospora sp. TT07R-123]GHJ46386.1 hypothetical protein Cs7R123_37280 [Catellatospora sp. TT07R-123]
MSGRASGADGREWWVGRRWLPWKPKPHRFRGNSSGGGFVDFGSLDLGDEPVGCTIALVFFALVVAFPLLLVLALFIAEWLLALLLLPLFVLVRTLFGVPWRVVARGRATDGRRWRYYTQAGGWRASGELIDRALEEIRVYGEPRCLGAFQLDEAPAGGTNTGSPERLLASVQAGDPLRFGGSVYGTDSRYARRGWLDGTLRADAVSLELSQGGGASRRNIPVLGGTAEADPEGPGGSRTVIGFTGNDGRRYRIAADERYLPALRWLQSQWSREG